jgi:hypothetical protein
VLLQPPPRMGIKHQSPRAAWDTNLQDLQCPPYAEGRSIRYNFLFEIHRQGPRASSEDLSKPQGKVVVQKVQDDMETCPLATS